MLLLSAIFSSDNILELNLVTKIDRDSPTYICKKRPVLAWRYLRRPTVSSVLKTSIKVPNTQAAQ